MQREIDMAIERVIGIDFGTSTSVIKVKTYKDNEPLGIANAVEYVRFDNKDSLPTLVYETSEGKYLIGYEAENAAVKGVLHQNFKMNLLNAHLRDEAVKLTRIFFKHMFDEYNEQKAYFPACDTETTYISYPAKWPEELRTLMLSIAREAGFNNVKGLDEPTAAIHTVMVQESGKLDMEGRDSVNILMIDMGAGTTDLVLCRYAPNQDKHIEILNTWPKDDSLCLFGGREVDEALCEYVKAYLIECELPNTKNFKEKYLDKCKTWKDANLSPILSDKNGVVRYCGFIDALLSMLDVDTEFPPLARSDFENMLAGYLTQFPKMVDDCLKDIGFNGREVDYVILTGGHSQWYFTNEILDGTLTRFGNPDLPRIRTNPNRIIRLSRPQETVALGLVFQKIAIMHERACIHCGKKIAVTDPFCGYCGRRNDRSIEAAKQPDKPAQAEIFCGHCGKKIPQDSIFCGYCGNSPTQERAVMQTELPKQTLITIARESQYICAACSYKVVVNGIDYGKIPVGQTKIVPSTTKIATVEILCTTILMTNHRVRLKLKLGKNPRINFKLQYGGAIEYFIRDAELIE
jgi:molecular chaperone DnaK (HSP70)